MSCRNWHFRARVTGLGQIGMQIVTGQGALARVERQGDVAIVRMARAPSNALAAGFCDQLRQMIAAQLQDTAVLGVVLASDLQVFSAGSDVADILSPAKGGRAQLGQLCSFVARAHKPVVAAIGGACLSTGFDLALAAQARVGGGKASFGFPDMRLGLLPAGGGTYRLTRLIGAQVAMDILLTGGTKPAEEALELGLIDRICAPGREVDEAVHLVQALAAPQTGAPPILVRRPFQANLPDDITAIDRARKNLPPKIGPWTAHHSLIDLIEGSLLLAEDMALAQDAVMFEQVQHSPNTRALSYAFVARQRGQRDQMQSKGHDDYAKVKAMLRRALDEVIALFCAQGLARGDVITALAAFGITDSPRESLPECPPQAQDVVPALLAAWANLGAKLMRNGAVPRADAVDYAALSGDMCPNWRGGPMFLADQRGAMVMRAELRRRAQAGDPRAQELFAPDPLWDALIAQSLTLAEVKRVQAPPEQAPPQQN